MGGSSGTAQGLSERNGIASTAIGTRRLLIIGDEKAGATRTYDQIRSYVSPAERQSRSINPQNNTARKLAIGGMIAGSLALGSQAQAKTPISDKQLLSAVLGEAENGGITGQRAVASALTRNGDAKAAHGAKHIIQKGDNFYRRYSDGRTDRQIPSYAVKTAMQAVQDAKKHDFSNGANHWFSKSDMKQANVRRMVRSMKLVGKFGDNYFYKE